MVLRYVCIMVNIVNYNISETDSTSVLKAELRTYNLI